MSREITVHVPELQAVADAINGLADRIMPADGIITPETENKSIGSALTEIHLWLVDVAQAMETLAEHPER